MYAPRRPLAEVQPNTPAPRNIPQTPSIPASDSLVICSDCSDAIHKSRMGSHLDSKTCKATQQRKRRNSLVASSQEDLFASPIPPAGVQHAFFTPNTGQHVALCLQPLSDSLHLQLLRLPFHAMATLFLLRACLLLLLSITLG